MVLPEETIAAYRSSVFEFGAQLILCDFLRDRLQNKDVRGHPRASRGGARENVARVDDRMVRLCAVESDSRASIGSRRSVTHQETR